MPENNKPGPPPKKRRGKPTKLLDDGLRNAILAGIAIGMPSVHAIRASGTTHASCYQWLRIGKESVDAVRKNPNHKPNEPFHTFYLDCQKAKSEGIRANLKIVFNAATGGAVVASKTTTKRTGVGTENETELTVEEVKKTGPDYTAATWMLTHAHSKIFSKDAIEINRLLDEVRELRREVRDAKSKADGEGGATAVDPEPRKEVVSDTPESNTEKR